MSDSLENNFIYGKSVEEILENTKNKISPMDLIARDEMVTKVYTKVIMMYFFYFHLFYKKLFEYM